MTTRKVEAVPAEPVDLFEWIPGGVVHHTDFHYGYLPMGCGYSMGDPGTMKNIMSKQVFTIGHSNLPLEQFLGMLARHQIEVLVDIRRFPCSRKFPHFNEKNLAGALHEAGIEYHWMEGLGGRRPKKKGFVSPNEGLENESFRNYADYMLTEEFRKAVGNFLEIAEGKRAALMCAESVYWRCHRRLVSDFLLGNGIVVQHIFPSGELRQHQPTPGAEIDVGKVAYPAEQKSLFE